MTDYIKVLNYLIELKKTNKPNKETEELFTNAWTTMMKIEGYPAAEEFLYNGFTYAGAKPLNKYIQRNKDHMAALKSIFRGKMYGENCVTTISLVFHLLALNLYRNNFDYKIIAALITEVPKVIRTKEGKIIS